MGLHIDESYQHSLQNHVKIIARDWNPAKCDLLKINFRENGLFYVWDGQHRLEAAKLRGIKYLLCDITVGLTQEQEAGRNFTAHRTGLSGGRKKFNENLIEM